MAGAGAGVHRDARRELHQVEASQEIAAYLRMQDGGGIVGRCGTIEGSPHPSGVERVGCKAIRRGGVRHAYPAADWLSMMGAACAVCMASAGARSPGTLPAGA